MTPFQNGNVGGAPPLDLLRMSVRISVGNELTNEAGRYATPGLFAASVRNPLKTGELTFLRDTNVCKSMKIRNVGFFGADFGAGTDRLSG